MFKFSCMVYFQTFIYQSNPPLNKKHIIPVIAFFTFIGGVASMAVPFLPFGWFLIFVTALLLLPYVKPFEKAFQWLARRDKTGISRKAGTKVAGLYRWAGDHKEADLITKMTEDSETERVADEKKKKAEYVEKP